ncbi:MAG: MerR family transcriptional regulator [Candidatus Dormibacteraceae bacterium]
MSSSTGAAPSVSPWLSLGEASRWLGITPATLRRWTDQGDVPAFVTPGGHRRFARTAIEALVPQHAARPASLAGLGASASRVARTYQRSQPAGRMSDAERAEFRDRGHRLLMLLLDYLNDDRRPRPAARLSEAVRSATEYGGRAAALGASQSEAVEAFVRFRGAFTGELAKLARRRQLGTQEATALLVEADRAVDRLLVALMSGHARGSA